MALKIDEILAINGNFEDFDVPSSTPTPEESELFSLVDANYLDVLHSYTNSSRRISKTDELLKHDTIWSVPREVFTNFKEPMHKRYFDVFYDQFSQFFLPIKPENKLNPIRDIILSYGFRKDYLYYAILASGARLSYQMTFLDVDQDQFSIFMGETSEMLEDLTYLRNFKSSRSHVLDVVYQRLEPLLLTILLLTSDNAARMEQSWRGHLRGAKDLLQKVFVEKLFPETKLLVFCKCWFTSFEILAGLGAPYGGTLVKQQEVDNLVINVDSIYETSVLKSFKIVGEDDYNYVFGFHSSLMPAVIELIKLIRTTSNNIFKDNLKSSEVFSLIGEFQERANFYEEDAGWKAVSHRCYAHASLLTLLSKFLEVPATNPLVQELVHNILRSINNILSLSENGSSSTPCELLLLHWPILVAGQNCVSDGDKQSVENLFASLNSLGSGAAKHSFDKIQKSWNHETPIFETDTIVY